MQASSKESIASQGADEGKDADFTDGSEKEEFDPEKALRKTLVSLEKAYLSRLIFYNCKTNSMRIEFSVTE